MVMRDLVSVMFSGEDIIAVRCNSTMFMSRKCPRKENVLIPKKEIFSVVTWFFAWEGAGLCVVRVFVVFFF